MCVRMKVVKARGIEGGLEKVMSPNRRGENNKMQAKNDYSVAYLLIPTLLLSLVVLRATVSELPWHVDAVCKTIDGIFICTLVREYVSLSK